MLRIEAPIDEVRALGRALRDLQRARPDDFAALFAPLGSGAPVALDDDTAALFIGFDLAARAGDGRIVGARRIRLKGSRLYVMELGDYEYHQDVWPETDALLGVLDLAPPGRLLDVGTGTGIVAIEAAVRGHRVVATDLYETALALARFNARLNGVEGIDFRAGHLFTPVAGERFDLVLTAPHYTRAADQLRLEALRAGPAHVAAGGRLVVATFLEWAARATLDGTGDDAKDDDGPLAAVATILAPLADGGAGVEVRPIESPVKRDWFRRARPLAPITGLVSRHRFLVTITPAGSRLDIERPAAAAQLGQSFVPLARLGRVAGAPRDAWAVVADGDDAARLGVLALGLERGVVAFDAGLPAGLHDACRFGARRCVSDSDASGAAGAILDAGGDVRPCTAGAALARWDDSFATLLERQRALAAAAFARRGCAGCAALAWCSRCLHPQPFAEADYCAFMRRPATRHLPRLFEVVAWFTRQPPPPRGLRVKIGRAAELVAARGRPLPVARPADDADDARLHALSGRLRESAAWLGVTEARAALFFRANGSEMVLTLDRPGAALAELIGDGANRAELEAYARAELMQPGALDEAIAHLERSLT